MVNMQEGETISSVKITDRKNTETRHFTSDLVKFNASSREINNSDIQFSVLLPPNAVPSSLPSTAQLV